MTSGSSARLKLSIEVDPRDEVTRPREVSVHAEFRKISRINRAFATS